MPIADICVLDVITCNRNTKIDEVAKLMRQHHVGDVVVMEESDEKQVPVGIITVRQDFGVFEAIQEMRKHGVRRMPVVNHEGTLAGIVSIDDLIELLADEMGELAKLISKEQDEEIRRKPAD